jgi:tetratricopeptide (TPR) repeat protein
MRSFALLFVASLAWAQQPADPTYAPSWNELAAKYALKARETSDYSWYAKADEAISRSLALAPDNYGANRVRVWALLGRDEYEKALELARKLKQQMPDDVALYGYMADAQFELGDYQDAVDSVGWMLRLRAGNAPALARAGYLREVHGDLPGAIEVIRIAYEGTSPSAEGDRAGLLAQWAREHWLAGQYAEAETRANQALAAVREFAPALEVLGRVRMSEGRYADAAEYFARHYRAAAHPENLYLLGVAQSKAGMEARARETFAQFEKEAVAKTGNSDNANRELIAYYVDFAKSPAKALDLAKREIARRHDVYTRDAYAWALAAAGDAEAASAEIRKAVELGVKDPLILTHAAAIAKLQAME